MAKPLQLCKDVTSTFPGFGRYHITVPTYCLSLISLSQRTKLSRSLTSIKKLQQCNEYVHIFQVHFFILLLTLYFLEFISNLTWFPWTVVFGRSERKMYLPRKQLGKIFLGFKHQCFTIRVWKTWSLVIGFVCACVCEWVWERERVQITVCICKLLCYSAKVLLAWFRAVKLSPHIVVFCGKGGQMLKLPLISERFWTNLSQQSTAVTLISKDQKGPNAQIQSREKQVFQQYDTDGFTTKCTVRVRGNVFVDVSRWCTMSLDFCWVSCFFCSKLGGLKTKKKQQKKVALDVLLC